MTVSFPFEVDAPCSAYWNNNGTVCVTQSDGRGVCVLPGEVESILQGKFESGVLRRRPSMLPKRSRIYAEFSVDKLTIREEEEMRVYGKTCKISGSVSMSRDEWRRLVDTCRKDMRATDRAIGGMIQPMGLSCFSSEIAEES